MFATLLGSRLRARVLGWLFTHPDERYFGRQLESLLGEDSTNISRELARLAVMGVLTCQTEGRQKYYQANAACPVFDELRGLAAKTFGLAEALQEFLRPLRRKVAVAFVYGSQAGGKARAASDVDLMVIGKATFGEVVAALRPAHDRLGREVNPTVYPEAEFRAKLAKKRHFLRAVMDGPKIFLVGDERVLKGLAEKCPYCAPKHGPRVIGGTAPR